MKLHTVYTHPIIVTVLVLLISIQSNHDLLIVDTTGTNQSVVCLFSEVYTETTMRLELVS